MTNAPFFSILRVCCMLLHHAQTKIKQPLCVCTRELPDGWARVDCASRASKKAPLGLFARRTVRRADAVRIHPPSPEKSLQNRKSSTRFGYWISWWARVDIASRAAKNSPPGCFCAVFCDSAAAVRIHPPSPEKSLQNRKSSTRFGYWISWWARVDSNHRS